MELQPGQTIDRYRVEAKLAAGGMATVYRVRHTKLDTLHALKVLQVPAQQLMDRLIQEGRAQAQLKHRNIVAVTDVIEVQGAPGLVMELVQGPSLHDLVAAQKLTIEQCDALARDIVRAVAHAHDKGMIHRDLKPANVMLAIEGSELVPKVTDFGLAKLLTLPSGTDKTASGLAMGTPAYMAPEQFRDAKNVDLRADVFSLGAILYELVTGERAFQGEEMIAVYQAVSTGNFADPAEKVPDIPERMAAAIRKALAIDPDDRLDSCDALLEVWCGTEITHPRRVAAAAGPWNQSLLDRATSLSPSQQVAAPALGGETATAPTIAPGSDINSSETLYASLEPSTGPVTWSDEAGAAPPPDSIAPPPPAPPQTRYWVALGLVLLGVTLPATLLAGMWLGGSFEPEAIPAPTPEPVPAAAPEREPAVAPEPEPEPAIEAEPTKAPAPEPAPVARPQPAPAAPAPAPAPTSATGTVTVTGEGTVVLVGTDGQRRSAGAVPPGSYDVLVTFPGKTERGSGKIEVPVGDTVTLKCAAMFNKCTVQH